ncbi:monocyte to macrophage differentiation factor-like [Patiria miniata]|uniref:Monocyte to macrophage differentiation factor n=1 Tax=Patiria miniata TaxID=46514 RepID=A0A914AKV9_PATMI|nr:monocyte to macrophage differentiation factor-like [Patiria miniata]
MKKSSSSQWLMNSPAKKGFQYKPTVVEHLANCITHGVWILPTFYAGHDMMEAASTAGEKANAVLFCVALLSVFIVSTTFHLVAWFGKQATLRFYLHISDRAIIYLFIAASYTPWLTLKKVGVIGQSIFCVVWVCAILGVIYSYCFYEKYKQLETALYLLLGIGPSVAVLDVQCSKDGIYELALGGLVYVLGVIFFKSDGIIPFAHAIWHLFVAAGAGLHFYAIHTYLMGSTDSLGEGKDASHPVHFIGSF